MRSILGELIFSLFMIYSQAQTALVSLIGKYPSTLSCSISLFSFHSRYVSSLPLC